MDPLVTLIDNILVPHQAYETATRRLEQCFRYASQTVEPVCIALVGESRTGKSRALEEFEQRHLPTRDADGQNVPILRVRLQSAPTVKSLVELLLLELGDPFFDKGTENAKTGRLQKLLKACGVTVVIVDEFQHFVERNSMHVLHHVADWLKRLVDETHVALVVGGLPYCQAVLEQNEQLAGRFMSPIFMPRFNWNDVTLRNEFIAILEAFDTALRDYVDLPTLHEGDMPFRCFCATGGLVGYLTKSLRQIIWNTLDAESRVITLADIELGNEEAVWKKRGVTGLANPFSREFSPFPSEELIARILEIGEPAPEPAIKRSRKLTACSSHSVSAVLSAS